MNCVCRPKNVFKTICSPFFMNVFICKKKNDLCYVFVDMIMEREIKHIFEEGCPDEGEFILSCVLLRFVDLNRLE